MNASGGFTHSVARKKSQNHIPKNRQKYEDGDEGKGRLADYLEFGERGKNVRKRGEKAA